MANLLQIMTHLTFSQKDLEIDLVKVLLVPSLNVSKLYYLRKLSTYNYTLFNLASKDVVCYMWHEGERSKGSSEIASCLERYMASLPSTVNHITFYSDTAGGQNRNQINAAMFLMYLKKHPSVHTIDQKFMESGHSQMEVDCVHSTVERMGRTNKIHSPFDWYTIVRSCRPQQPYNVIEMEHADFQDHKKVSSSVIKNRNKVADESKVLWTKLKWIRYQQDDLDAFFVKERLQDDLPFTRIQVITRKRRSASSWTMDIPPLYTEPLSIQSAKLKDLLKIAEDLPENRRGFFQSLKSSSVHSETVESESEEEE
ncbi:hypothetical protein CAPTEDRAFT_203816 [Capitella teleta]|uniref:DUF4371 domain-containing protein n=1 Tax=Capitella teleta TaxID=283909 RepID=R7V3J2_CAPTE|nr:hypothetical protein CAPTEDRAFT_203816 [Capitella teleta]|eukprot:ELU13042.1 hypothetical protein CAPTEDRAFT_203816 [Capitella teleta]